MIMKKILPIAFVFLPFLICAQTDSLAVASKWQFEGYLKNLQTLTFTGGVNSLITNTSLQDDFKQEIIIGLKLRKN